MKKVFLTLLIFCIGLGMAKAQRTLNFENLSDESVTYDGGDNEAGVVLQCKSDLILDFESNMDLNVNIYNIENDKENNIATYYLIFKAGRRTLTIKADTYNPLDIPLDLKPHQLDVYSLFDPNDKIDGTYYQLHRERGQQYFDNCDYISARDEFRLALNWNEITEVEDAEAQGLIANCDSILAWRRIGFEAADLLDLDKAYEYLQKAQALNPLDKNIVNKVYECIQMQEARCKNYLEAGNKFFNNKEYQDAILMYKKVEDNNGQDTQLALSQRIKAETLLQGRKNLERYFGVELGKTWGFTYGTYRNITGGYLTLGLNKYCMDLISSKFRPEDYAEFDISFGWTLPVVKATDDIFRGAWLHLGLGAALYNKFEIDNDFKYGTNNRKMSLSALENEVGINISAKNTVLTNDALTAFIDKVNEKYGSENNSELEAKDILDMSLGLAITPEIGFLVKVWHFALRGTYKYHYSLNTDFDDLFSKSRFSVGIGFCW